MAKKNKTENDNKKTKFYISQKTYFLTFPQCDLEKEYVLKFYLEKFDPSVIIIAKEKHKDENNHIHVWLEFKSRITIRNSRYFDIDDFHCNIGKIRKEECNNRKNAYNYLIKFDKNPIIYGIDLIELSKGIRKKICYDLIKKKKTLMDVIEEYPQELYFYNKLKNNLTLYNLDKEKLPFIFNRKCYWIYGPSGVGKSYLVRLCFNNLYEKPLNIWWDGYNGEDVVLIDDYDKSGLKLSYYLKIWGDNYRFNAEVKGGTIQPKYNILIITSNYSIRDLTYHDMGVEIYDAISRRFKEIHMIDRDQQDDIIIKILGIKIYRVINNLKIYYN